MAGIPGRWRSCSLTLRVRRAIADELDLAVPILGDGERWHAVLAIDAALDDGTFFATSFNDEGISEARMRAVAAARAASGYVTTDRDTGDRDRDAIIRYAIAELETLAGS